MPALGFIGRGSFYKEIIENLGSRNRNAVDFTPSTAVRIRPTEVLVNYGLHGERLGRWQARMGRLADLFAITLNPKVYGNKLECVQAVERVAPLLPHFKVPQSVPMLSPAQMGSGEWIKKPYWSFGGRDIEQLNGSTCPDWSKFYAQQRVRNRRYELRVHVFNWLPMSEWLVSKRTHPDGESVLTWNHHQGGTFMNIEPAESNTGVFARAKQAAALVAKTLKYDFCSVDFIAENVSSGSVPIYFIEANLATGFTTDRTKEVYCDAFFKLANMSEPEIRRALRSDTPQQPAAPTPTPPPVQSAPRPRAPFEVTDADKLKIIRFLTASHPQVTPDRRYTNEELITFINSLR
jgi:hypothetical protein